MCVLRLLLTPADHVSAVAYVLFSWEMPPSGHGGRLVQILPLKKHTNGQMRIPKRRICTECVELFCAATVGAKHAEDALRSPISATRCPSNPNI